MLDEADIRTFITEDYPRLVGAVAVACGNRATAEDAVQEAIVRAWQRSERGEAIERLDAWVATTALNLSRSALRRVFAERRARERLFIASPEDSAPTGGVDLSRAIRRLPRRQREAIVLRGVLELRIGEIARAMGTSEGTVKSQLSKARTSLAAALALEADDDERETDRAEA